SSATRKGGPRGCLVLNTVTGGSTPPVEIQERVRASVERNTPEIEAAPARDPALAGRADPPPLARFFPPEGHGLSVLARAGVRAGELERAAEVSLSVLGPQRGAGKRSRSRRGRPRIMPRRARSGPVPSS